jgi:predicted DNA binding CopG/RHH family protein
MSAKVKYSDEPLGDVEIIRDFLPSPDDLAFRDETVKVTISLSKSSVDFFKEKAKEHNTPYQKMIRRLLDSYVEQFKRPTPYDSSNLDISKRG